jgi:hypothetical protein
MKIKMKYLKRKMKENSQKQFTLAIASKKNQQEKGVALILAIALLVILMIVGLAFVSLIQIDRQRAASKLDVVTAKLSAESVLERVIGSIQLYNDDLTDGKIYPGTSSFFKMTDLKYEEDEDKGWNNRRVIFSHETTEGKETNDLIQHFRTSFKNSDGNSRDYIDWDDSEGFTKIPDLKNIHWKYLKIDEDGDGGGDKEKTIGRIAYIIIDESGKIDPNYITTGSERIGKDVFEIDLADAGVTNPSDFKDSLGDAPKWFSWAHIIGETGFDQDELDTCTSVLFPYSYDIEACWIDKDKDGQYDSDEDFHRFNLARTDWDSLTVDKIVHNPAQFDTTQDTHEGEGIKWINDFSEVGNFASLDARRKQIAANLIDYCDSDSIPTADKAPATWNDIENPPKYTGNDLHPMISEIWVRGQLTVNVNSTEWDYAWTYYLGVEICNPYNVWLPGDAIFQCLNGDDNVPNIRMEMNKADGTYWYSTQTQGPNWSNNEVVISGPFPPGSYTYNETLYKNVSKTYYHSYATGDKSPSGKFMWNVDSARLFYDGTTVESATLNTGKESGPCVDYVEIKSGQKSVDLPLGNVDPEVGGYGVNTINLHLAVGDPRNNLHIEDWNTEGAHGIKIGSGVKNVVMTSWPYGSGTGETPGEPNVGETSSNSGDKEQQKICTTPGEVDNTGTERHGIVSTAYIKNAPMQSPWELGCIHRGKAWETINLKAYNDGAIGGGAYADGDANILDQIKMTSDTVSYGKVNINSPIQTVHDALVNISVTGDYTNSTTVIPDSDKIEAIAKEILEKNGTTMNSEIPPKALGQAFKNRAQVANVSALGVGQTTDAAKEEIIGKFINLTTVRKNYFTVLILAQSLNKAGKVTAEQKILAVIYRDAFTNECKVPYYEVLSEKTGTSLKWKKKTEE